jgi:predicted transcriptional regulator
MDQPEIKRRRGGQPKPLSERKNRSLTIRVLDALRERLEQAAEASGRSVSEEAAYRMTLGFMLETELKDLAEIRKDTDDALRVDLVRRGWGKTWDPRYNGAVFTPPGQLTGIPQSGFRSPEEVKIETDKVLEDAERRIRELRKGA